MSLPNWLAKIFPQHSAVRSRKTRARQPRIPLTITALEERMAPALLTVNSLIDAPVSGTTPTLSLREAILLIDSGGTATDAAGNSLIAAKASQINTTNPFGTDDTVVFDSSLTGQSPIVLTQGELLLTANMTIMGGTSSQIAVSGNGTSRVFEIAGGVTVNITGLTLENGSAALGGGIANAGTLTLTDSTVSDNTAQVDNGGIYNLPGGTMTVVDSVITGNSAAVGNGGVGNYGVSLALVESTVSGNSALGGGGIGNYAGTMTLTDSTVIGNTGGGILNMAASSVTDSTIIGNSAINGGGSGIDNYAGTMTLTDSTVSGNTGGGILNAAALTVTDCAIIGNSANGGGGIANTGTLLLTGSTVSDNSAIDDGGIVNYAGGTMTVLDSIISGNSAAVGNGGVANYGTSLTLVDSNITGNSALGGGGIGNYAGTMTLTDSTVSNNSGGGILNMANLSVADTVVSNNSGCDIVNTATLALTDSTVSNSPAMASDPGIVNLGGTVTLVNSTVPGNSDAAVNAVAPAVATITVPASTATSPNADSTPSADTPSKTGDDSRASEVKSDADSDDNAASNGVLAGHDDKLSDSGDSQTDAIARVTLIAMGTEGNSGADVASTSGWNSAFDGVTQVFAGQAGSTLRDTDLTILPTASKGETAPIAQENAGAPAPYSVSSANLSRDGGGTTDGIIPAGWCTTDSNPGSDTRATADQALSTMNLANSVDNEPRATPMVNALAFATAPLVRGEDLATGFLVFWLGAALISERLPGTRPRCGTIPSLSRRPQQPREAV
jgi:hypothetical protein